MTVLSYRNQKARCEKRPGIGVMGSSFYANFFNLMTSIGPFSHIKIHLRNVDFLGYELIRQGGTVA